MGDRVPRRYGVSWREGEPETAIKWHSGIGQMFAEVRFFRFDPRELRRISSSWWYYPSIDGASAVEQARWCEDRTQQVSA